MLLLVLPLVVVVAVAVILLLSIVLRVAVLLLLPVVVVMAVLLLLPVLVRRRLLDVKLHLSSRGETWVSRVALRRCRDVHVLGCT